jgi:hypothetical protein
VELERFSSLTETLYDPALNPTDSILMLWNRLIDAQRLHQ